MKGNTIEHMHHADTEPVQYTQGLFDSLWDLFYFDTDSQAHSSLKN